MTCSKLTLLASTITLACIISFAVAQDAAPESAGPPDKPSSAEQVLQQMLEKRQDNPELDQAPARGGSPSGAGALPGKVPVADSAIGQVDPRVLGHAPGMATPALIREGQFIVSRRGRLVRGQGPNETLFVFESDARNAPEPPMIMMPCRLLQSMEDHVRERGEVLVFVVTGQVFEYRSANYMLATIMRIDYDQGNLEK